MTTITIDRELLEQALEVIVANTVGAEDIEDTLRSALSAPATTPDLSAAYIGAREDLAIWKKRALEAEETARQLNRALAEEVNGPTFMGEPVLPATAPAQPSWHDAPTAPGIWINRVSMRAMEIDASVLKAWGKADVRWFGPLPEDKQ